MRILLLRFSSMGDVALLAPVLRAVCELPAVESIVLATRRGFEPFFRTIPRLTVVGLDPVQAHRGPFGLFRLMRELRRHGPYDAVLDAHDNLRSGVIRIASVGRVPRRVTIDKGREEKRRATDRHHPHRAVLPHTVERYAKLFETIGLPVRVGPAPWIIPGPEGLDAARALLAEASGTGPLIGMAPFAKHVTKEWPADSAADLLRRLAGELGASVFLFGGAPEADRLRRLAPPGAVVVAGRADLNTELHVMNRMHLMVCMDSGNMHLAALLGRPVVSIWGGTHPDLGFRPYGDQARGMVQVPVDDLSCRPCSVFGSAQCYRGDRACLTRITPEQVLERIQARLVEG